MILTKVHYSMIARCIDPHKVHDDPSGKIDTSVEDFLRAKDDAIVLMHQP